jgi:hypothetical protein
LVLGLAMFSHLVVYVRYGRGKGAINYVIHDL